MMVDNLDRDRWESAALDALERGGLAAVAVEPLARELGVTKGSFYWHFKNRGELIAATVARWERLHVDGPLEALASVEDPRARLMELLGKAGAKPPSIFVRLLDAVDAPVVRAAVARAAQERVAFMARAFGELGLTRATARRQALLAYSAYVGRAHLARDAPELLGDPAALSKHIAEQLIG
ncbi:MAG TPA: helix-turn-helix domain-containing protein [Baekduia sp.]|uniref:TetR/AcrR family transcriptional regulator n=1 Tax=Baekduia sp. TaxID=2600305 RepID=UPI002C9A1BFE|nr:helix-turn-helix domain-containing protein [Baekduia sp.]HMJ36849.1 helix-turn-helix domain-containing protein [Baekduia sp.]